MKPSIVVWAYVGLAYILLNKIMDVGYFFRASNYFPFLTMAVLVVTTVAVFGLVKRTSWARMVASSIIAAEVFLMLYTSMFLQSVMLEDESHYFLISSLVFGVPLLFLAYKIYTSEPLKIYLSNSPHATR